MSLLTRVRSRRARRRARSLADELEAVLAWARAKPLCLYGYVSARDRARAASAGEEEEEAEVEDGEREAQWRVDEVLPGLSEELLLLRRRVAAMADREVLEEQKSLAANVLRREQKSLDLAKRKMEAANRLAEMNAAAGWPGASSPALLEAGFNPSINSLSTQKGNSLRHQNSLRRRWFTRLRRLGSGADELVETGDLDLLGRDFWVCFRVNQSEALAELRIDLEQAQRNFDRASENYSEAEIVLQERRANDFRLLDILERFYGQEPGDEKDAVACAIAKEAKQLGEIEKRCEKGRAELLIEHQKTSLALQDQKNALDAAICALEGYGEIVKLLREARLFNLINVWHSGARICRHLSLTIRKYMSKAAQRNMEANRKARTAQLYSPDAPPIRSVNIERSCLIGGLDIVFNSPLVHLMVRKKVTAAYEDAVNAYNDCEKTVKFLEEYSGRIQNHLGDCKYHIERWDRMILKKRADIFRRNHAASVIA